jgi:hypothetical protein
VATQVSGGNWWININNVWIGYYPESSFNGQMLTAATYFSFGGELYDSEPGGHHTTAQMGDGTKPTTSGFGTTAYQRDFAYFNPCSGGVCWFRASGNDLYNISAYDSYPPLNGGRFVLRQLDHASVRTWRRPVLLFRRQVLEDDGESRRNYGSAGLVSRLVRMADERLRRTCGIIERRARRKSRQRRVRCANG